MLHTIERSGYSAVLNRRDRAKRHQLVVRPGHVHVFELARIQSVYALNLRDDLVTTTGNIEPVHEIAADHGGKIGPDLFHIEAKSRDLVVIDQDLRFGLVDLGIDGRRESENASLHSAHFQLLC